MVRSRWHNLAKHLALCSMFVSSSLSSNLNPFLGEYPDHAIYVLVVFCMTPAFPDLGNHMNARSRNDDQVQVLYRYFARKHMHIKHILSSKSKFYLLQRSDHTTATRPLISNLTDRLNTAHTIRTPPTHPPRPLLRPNITKLPSP